MTEYDNNLRGALFRNDKKRDGKKDPDYKGQCEVDGMEFWMAAWIQKSKGGDTYMSIRFTPKDESRQRENIEKMPSAKAEEGFSDDIPF